MERKVIVNGTLIDGKGRKIDKSVVVIKDNVIESVGIYDREKIANYDDLIIDINNKVIMPGMIDAHTHHTTSSCNDSVYETIKDYLAIRTMKSYLNFMTTLNAGYTSVRDVGAIGYIDVAIRTLVNENKILGPRIIASGKAICQTGGHSEICSTYPWITLEGGGAEEIADGVAEVRKAVRKQVRMGVDLIKVFASSGIYDPFLGKPRQEYSKHEMSAIIDEAHVAGKKVAVHCHIAETAKMCINLGADSIEHGMFIDEECLEMMVKNDIVWVPTISVFLNISEGLNHGVSESSVINAKNSLLKVRKTFEKALELGVKIGIGTDSGTIRTSHGENAKELEILNNWGMSEMDCITSTTSLNAELLGISDLTGSIEVGKEADIIIIDGNPLDDIRILQKNDKIVAILKGGQVVKNTYNYKLD